MSGKSLYIVLLSLIVPTGSYAQNMCTADDGKFHLLSAEQLQLKVAKLDPNNRDPLAPDYTGRWGQRASLLWRIAVFDRIYWQNDIHTDTIDSGSVKTVGWHWEAGLRLFPGITPYWEHHSRHIMDEGPENNLYPDHPNQFPVDNSYGVKFDFIDEKTGKFIFFNK